MKRVMSRRPNIGGGGGGGGSRLSWGRKESIKPPRVQPKSQETGFETNGTATSAVRRAVTHLPKPPTAVSGIGKSRLGSPQKTTTTVQDPSKGARLADNMKMAQEANVDPITGIPRSMTAAGTTAGRMIFVTIATAVFGIWEKFKEYFTDPVPLHPNGQSNKGQEVEESKTRDFVIERDDERHGEKARIQKPQTSNGNQGNENKGAKPVPNQSNGNEPDDEK